MEGKRRVDVLEAMFVMIVLLLAKFCGSVLDDRRRRKRRGQGKW